MGNQRAFQVTLAALVAVLGPPGSFACDLTLTGAPLTYEDLTPEEQAAADRVLAGLRAYETRLTAADADRYTLGPIADDVNRIDVAVRDAWVLTNLGDDRVHLTTWENLSEDQRDRWTTWLGPGEANARARYQVFFYDLGALHLAGIQTVYAVQGVEWVYSNRSVFNLDRDAQRLVVTYLAQYNGSLLSQGLAYCGTLTGIFNSRWASHYDQEYYLEHFRELTDPDDPAGYLYFLCRHMQAAETRRRTYATRFADEIMYVEMRRDGDGDEMTVD